MSKNTIDLNTADQTALEQIPGVGPELAAKIILHRKQNGPFRSWEDLKKIPGMHSAIIDTLKQHGITVGRKVA
jgi:competence protein ComEA